MLNDYIFTDVFLLCDRQSFDVCNVSNMDEEQSQMNR